MALRNLSTHALRGELPVFESILIVDDEPHLLIAASHRLRSCGYHVITARDGSGALDLARREKADVAILDLRMPGLDGFETFSRLRSLPGWESVPVIFLSANAQSENRERAMEMGGRLFLQKPCDARRLVAAVEEAIRSSRADDRVPISGARRHG